MSEPRRRRGPRRPSEAPELDESALVAELRRRAWAWLHGLVASVEVAASPEAAASAEVALEPPTKETPEPRLQGLPIEIAPPANDGGSAPAKRRRAAKRDAPEVALGSFRRRAWSWLKAPAAPAITMGETPKPPPRAIEGPARRKRAPKREAALPDGVKGLRRKAWWWLRPHPAAQPAEAEPPKRRRGKREAALPEGVAELRRRAWAWFAPRATGEAAAGTHVPVRTVTSSTEIPGGEVVRAHLKGVLEALIFASEHPLPARELARVAQADLKLVKILLAELVAEYHPRGLRLDEIAGGFVFRTSPAFAPFVREQVAKKPVKMSRAQIETLAIVAYRQPITRPEIDEVRGVDSGAVLKSLLERELVRIIGKKDEPGRPMLYGTTGAFLELFGMKALGDLPTLREFTELTDESKRAYERELGEEPPHGGETGLMGGEGEMRKPAAAPPPVIDVSALEDDPTLPPEPASSEAEPPASPEAAVEPRASASGPEPRASASGPPGEQEPEPEQEPQEQEQARQEPEAEPGEDEADEEEDEGDEDDDEDDEDDEDDDEDEDEDEDDEDEDEDEDDEDDDEDDEGEADDEA